MHKVLFNDGWQFALQGIGEGAPQADAWQAVEIPHDWLIWDTTDLYRSGEGWYRKTFARPGQARTLLRFDGVYMDATVYLNGAEAFVWKYGYSTFTFDCTELLREGENEILVRVCYQAPNSRWYSGAGIYRNVWMLTGPDVYLVPDGIYITPVREDAGVWRVEVDAELSGEWTGHEVEHVLRDKAGREVMRVRGGTSQQMQVNEPALWDIESPVLYAIQTTLYRDGQPVQQVESTFGFREIAFRPESGFWLNGRYVRLHGACQHHDLGCLGAALNRDALARQLRKLREMGINAIRTAHNMPAPELMELADSMGFLICSEAFDMWERSKTEYDYARFFPEWAARDVASWIRRDRNCPSVILWSIGNEIYDTHADARGLQVTKMLHELVRQHDPKGHAPTTIGSNYMMGEGAQRCADVVKLAGYNYAERLYDPHHAAHPDWVIYGSETGSVVQSRGIYHFPLRQPLLADDDLQCSALGNSATSWGARNTEACILADENTPYSAGQFIWTGTDYIGEPTPYHTRNSYFGQVDTAGFEKDSFYIFQSAWTDWQAAPMVHVFPYWDFSPGQPIDVRVCSNAPEVELFAGGQSLGRRRLGIAENKLVADYQLPYAVGTLRAVAYDPQGNIIAQQARSSFSDAVQLKLQAEETTLAADGQSLAFLTVSAVDVAGNPVENASNRVQVQVRGAGRLVGLDNGDSTDTDPYKGHTKNLFSGKLLAVVAATLEAGDVEVIVSTPGLKGASITLTSKPAPQAPGSSRTLMSSRPDLDRPGLETFIPVRKVELRQAGDFALTPERPSTRIRATIFPANASDQSLLWDVTNAAGIPSNIATLAVEGHEAVLTAIGDGEVWLRCMSRSGADHVRLIAQLCFTVSGMGTPFLDPYGFISGGLYTSSSAELTNGNERGIATPRDEESYVTFAGIDFGPYGADTITLPLFSLTAEPFPIEIWEGIPGETGSEHLCTVTYTSGSIWNTYQAETYTLPRRLTGVKALSFVLRQKVHIKGFSFQRAEKAFARLAAGEHDALYGDDYTVSGSRVEAIGNNVTLRFEGMDFTRDVPDTVTIWGRTPLAGNTIHLRLWHREEEHAQAVDTAHILEFAHAEAYTAQTFALRGVKPGVYDVEFVFLPGSRFDFEAFQMGRSKKE